MAESMDGYKGKYPTYLFSLSFNLSLLLSDIIANFSMIYFGFILVNCFLLCTLTHRDSR